MALNGYQSRHLFCAPYSLDFDNCIVVQEFVIPGPTLRNNLAECYLIKNVCGFKIKICD